MNRVANNPMMGGGVDKSKQWQMELLMEKIRSKSSQYKPFTETAKTVKMTLLEKRYPLDSVEKNQHQKCLDTLQHSIKVTSLQSMVERLESLTRQLGLKFMVGPSGVELFISSEMFYLEIILDANGAVKDVKIHHEGKVEQQSCIELVNCLAKGDFADFTAQLEGLSSIYQINAEKKIKCKAFSALQALETDLSTLAQLQTFIKEPFNLLLKSPVGFLEKRKGGHPMKLTYFVSPYDLLDKEKGLSDPLTVESVTSKNLGYSVTVCIEGSGSHKLQTSTIISVNRNMNGKNTPSYAPLSNQNSAVLPACFVLRLNKPLPMCVSLVRRIQQVTEMDCGDLSTTHPLMSLITQHVSNGQLDCAHNKGLFVTLPDQHHCYFMTESKSMEGVLVSNIPFSHPTHVPQILVFLRQQALFNCVISSCIRPCSKQDLENMIMFEISALSWQHISISLEHPIEESMATAELDLSDISNVICKIHTPTSSGMLSQAGPDPTSELASRVFQRSLSIPITMRAVIKLWDEQVNRKNHINGNENFSLTLRAVDPGGQNGNTGNPLTDFGGLDGKIKNEHSNSGNGHSLTGNSMSHPHQGMFLNESMMAGAGFPNFSGSDGSLSMLNNMEISSLLSGTPSTSQSSEKSSSKRSSKRKASEDLWKNPKRKAEDNDMLMESSSSDSNSVSTPMSQEGASEIATPNSALGFHSDLELSGLDATELMNQTEKEKAGSEYDSREADEDVEDILLGNSRSEHKSRKREEKKSTTPNLLLELGEKQNLVPACVSITPISSSPNSQGFNSSERRPGIEIIPIATTPTPSLPSSITITPIAPSHSKSSSEERSKEKKSSKSRSEDKNKLEKKRKKKRDEESMGPPDKLPPKQDPLTKPVSVSIKPAESPPLPNITPTSPSMLRKYSTSPTQGRSLNISGKSSPSMLKPIKSSSSSHPSPKHSPAHVMSSPKHTLPGISSPKNHGTSPKHPSTSGSGKPSMSTLKSAANSPSSKSSDSFKSKSTSKESSSSRDKDKKSSSSSSVFSVNNPKVKSSSVKLKQLDLSAGGDITSSSQQSSTGGTTENLPSPSGTVDLSKSSSLNQVRNRKGSLSAVIDKLKSAQHVSESDTQGNNGKSANREGRSGSSSSKVTENKTGSKIGEAKNSEYMVKPSSDGIKLTINKTRTKESSKSSSNISKSQSSAGTGSPKTHTGLKPGVNSGPASKKPQTVQQKSSSSSSLNSSSTSYTKSSKTPSLSKSSSSLNVSKSTSKLSGSPKTSSNPSDLSRNKDRPRLSKSSSEKSIFKDRKSSPTRDETDSERAFKMLSKLDQGYPSPLLMEGMISMKSLDTNFQIPKLSARSGDSEKKPNKISNPPSYPENLNNLSQRGTVDLSKMYDKNDILPKYPLLPSKNFENSLDNKRNNLGMSSSSPLLPLQTNPLSFASSSNSPKLNLGSTHLKDETVNLSGPDLTVSIAETLDKSVKKDLISKDDPTNCNKLNYPISAKNFSTSSESSKDAKFSSPQPKLDDKKLDLKKTSTTSQEAAEMLLDFSTNTINKAAVTEHLNKLQERVLPLIPAHRNTTSPLPLGPPSSYPASPSVSVHIVKSPASPPPRINPSPHSASPCITDDELMDEALVGLGK